MSCSYCKPFKMWRVSLLEKQQWFVDEAAARQYARERADIELDGIPFIDSYLVSDSHDVMELLNEYGPNT